MPPSASASNLSGRWEVLAEQVQTRRNGLVSQTTWLLNLGPEGPRFAMLLDYFPASAGRRTSAFTPGERFRGEVAFFSGRNPLRGLLLQRAAHGAIREALRTPAPVEGRRPVGFVDYCFVPDVGYSRHSSELVERTADSGSARNQAAERARVADWPVCANLMAAPEEAVVHINEAKRLELVGS